MSKRSAASVVDLRATPAHAQLQPLVQARAALVGICDDGTLQVQFQDGTRCVCDWLETAATASQALAEGDEVLVACGSPHFTAVVLGRIGRYRAPTVQARLTLEASETLTLKCGEASVDLRADGKVMVRGEDVLLRAKGTQSIRAGNVSIN